MDRVIGRTIAVTGAARGIGFATARALLARGARVVLGEFASRGVEVTVVMPPFTQTDLIAGMKSSGLGKPVAPGAVAAAIVGALDNPRTYVALPQPSRIVGPIVAMLGARSRRWLNKRIGADTLFLGDVDQAARRHYEERAQSAVGVVEPSA
jgi:NAD(P)-dependent dehydrogenase (short-subunit alcohol dehydrogenase family)